MSRPRLIALLLAFSTLLVFLPAGRFDFLNYDDPDYVMDNPVVKQGLTAAGVKWAFGFHASNWHPLTWLSHMADCTLFDLNPGAHHFINVLLHAANAALLFILLRRLTNRLWPCALVAALFACHPLRVESVAWVSERKDVLCAFFWLLALLAYAKRDACCVMREPRAGSARITHQASRFYWLAFLFFAFALLSKPMAVTLPFVLLLLDYWPLGEIRKQKLETGNLARLIIEKIPFFVLSEVSCGLTFFAQKNGEAVVSLARFPLSLRLENVPVAMVGYLRQSFWPSGLCAIYPMPDKIAPWLVALSVVILVVVSAVAYGWRRSRPYFLIGWLWFLATLIPVIGLVQVGGQAMADRYTYLPSIGLFIALVFLAADFLKQFQMPMAIQFGCCAAILAAFICVTEHQLQFWRDSETLFRRAVVVTSNNTIALINLGAALESQGRLEEALKAFREAENSGRRRYEIHGNLGDVLSRFGRHEEARAEYERAIALRPDNAVLHNSLGIEWAALNQFSNAFAEFAAAEKLNPNFAAPHIEAAVALFKAGRDREGVGEFREALRREPDNFKILATAAHYLAAAENAEARDGKTALELALKANEFTGHSQPLVLDVLGMAYAETGDFTNAVASAQEALNLAESAKLKTAPAIRQRLELFQQKQPWRETFAATNVLEKN
jgi:protein O-mannosyl-transferase